MNTTEKIVFEKENKQVIQQGKKFFTRVLENGEYFESGDFNTLERAKENLNIIPTTTENNKIIAEFLGFKLTDRVILPEKYKVDESCFSILEFIDMVRESDNLPPCSIENLKFNKDWNWLMEVVQKIENWENGQYYIIHSMYFNKRNISIKAECNRDFKNIDIFYNEGEKIQATYNACVEFITWYNLQNS